MLIFISNRQKIYEHLYSEWDRAYFSFTCTLPEQYLFSKNLMNSLLHIPDSVLTISLSSSKSIVINVNITIAVNQKNRINHNHNSIQRGRGEGSEYRSIVFCIIEGLIVTFVRIEYDKGKLYSLYLHRCCAIILLLLRFAIDKDEEEEDRSRIVPEDFLL